MLFLACLPLIEVDIPAVLSLDQRCLGGLWTASGYLKELESDHSDLCVLVSSRDRDSLQQRQQNTSDRSVQQKPTYLAATDPTQQTAQSQMSPTPIQLLGIGCLWAILEEAHITTLAIEPNYQGQKLGLLLLAHLLTCGRNRGLTRATLEVRASNQTAFNLYNKFGFSEAGERKRYYADGENARILWRSGLQTTSCAEQICHYRKEAITALAQQNYTILTPSSHLNYLTLSETT